MTTSDQWLMMFWITGVLATAGFAAVLLPALLDWHREARRRRRLRCNRRRLRLAVGRRWR